MGTAGRGVENRPRSPMLDRSVSAVSPWHLGTRSQLLVPPVVHVLHPIFELTIIKAQLMSWRFTATCGHVKQLAKAPAPRPRAEGHFRLHILGIRT